MEATNLEMAPEETEAVMERQELIKKKQTWTLPGHIFKSHLYLQSVTIH
jgi:hypothetical protein